MEHYKVYDKDGKLLVSDIVISIKSDVAVKTKKDNKNPILKIDLISFDGKYFLKKNILDVNLLMIVLEI